MARLAAIRKAATRDRPELADRGYIYGPLGTVLELHHRYAPANPAAGLRSVRVNPRTVPHRGLGRTLRVRCSVLVNERSVTVRTHHVDVGAGRQIVRVAGAYFQVDRQGRPPVLEVMSVAAAHGEGRVVSCAKHGLRVVLDECQLAIKDEDELVFMAVPVSLARPLAWGKRHQVDAERLQAARVSQSLASSPGACVIERIRVAGPHAHGHGGNIDFRHKGARRIVLSRDASHHNSGVILHSLNAPTGSPANGGLRSGAQLERPESTQSSVSEITAAERQLEGASASSSALVRRTDQIGCRASTQGAVRWRGVPFRKRRLV